MTTEQINMLPAAERATYIQIVRFFDLLSVYALDISFLSVRRSAYRMNEAVCNFYTLYILYLIILNHGCYHGLSRSHNSVFKISLQIVHFGHVLLTSTHVMRIKFRGLPYNATGYGLK